MQHVVHFGIDTSFRINLCEPGVVVSDEHLEVGSFIFEYFWCHEIICNLKPHIIEMKLQIEVHTAESLGDLAAKVEHLKEELGAEKAKRRQLWKTSYEQVAEQNALLTS